MCCKYKYCPENLSSSTNSGTADNNRRRSVDQEERSAFQNIELATPSASYSNQPIRASAPVLDEKDLPPTYESLFIKNEVTIPK